MSLSAFASSHKHRISYQTLLLAAVALLTGTLLTLAYSGTRGAIAERGREDLLASLAQVIPPALYDNQILNDTVTVAGANGEPVTVYRARRDGEVVAVGYQQAGQGYSGTIRVLLGVGRDGRLLGARVLSHTETPGLGDKIELAKDDWILDFNGRSLESPPPARWTVEKDGGAFDQFTGATITPRATVAIIRGGLELFAAHRPRLLDLTPPPTAVINQERP